MNVILGVSLCKYYLRIKNFFKFFLRRKSCSRIFGFSFFLGVSSFVVLGQWDEVLQFLICRVINFLIDVSEFLRVFWVRIFVCVFERQERELVLVAWRLGWWGQEVATWKIWFLICFFFCIVRCSLQWEEQNIDFFVSILR